MKVAIEKRKIVGTLLTQLGSFPLLDERIVYHQDTHLSVANVIDPEGFTNFLTIRGGFIIVPSALPELVDVKIVLSKEEETEHIISYDDGTKDGEALELKPDDILFDLRNGGVD